MPDVFLNKCYKNLLMIVSILKENIDLIPILNQIIQEKKILATKKILRSYHWSNF